MGLMNQRVQAGTVLALWILAPALCAQSSDWDHPTPFEGTAIAGSLTEGSKSERFYSFVAIPGELTVTIDVSSESGVCNPVFSLSDSDANEIFSELAQSGGGTEREVQRVRVNKQSPVILQMVDKYGYCNGRYKVQLGGAFELASPAASPRSDRGVLRIEMLDGTVTNLRLDEIRSISINP